MPVQSFFTSRKSAEQLAKFIYLTAHNQIIESMTFVDILNDQAVRNFIHDRSVMDAFHSIRKNGNRAVHDDSKKTEKEAIEVLEDLHYVAGEIACITILGTLFNSDVSEQYIHDREQEWKKRLDTMAPHGYNDN
jgi:hypothetical protein